MTTPNQTQEPSYMSPVPREEHRWLQQLVGDWTVEAEMAAEPGQSPSKFFGTETVRTIGEIWVQGQGQSDMPGGGTGHTQITLGYDPVRRRFVGTWLGSMMNFLWVYDGELDAEKRVLSLYAEGPDMSGAGGMAKYKDVIELISNDHRTLSGHMLDEKGTWQRFMTTHYRRKR